MASTPDMSTVAGQAYAYAATVTNLARTAVITRQASAILVAEVATPTLTPAEVEAVVGVTRARLQGSIDDVMAVFPTHRAYPVAEALRTAALAVQELGRAVIHRHPPLISTTLTSAGSLHLIAHRLYGDWTRAAELARLNPGIRNPNFLAAGQTILRYAK